MDGMKFSGVPTGGSIDTSGGTAVQPWSFELGSYAKGLTASFVTLIVGPKTAAVNFYVHSSVLINIPFFNAGLTGNFKEAETKIMHLPEDTPEIVAKLIEYLYTGKYTVDPGYLPSTEKEFEASQTLLSSSAGNSTETISRHLSGPTNTTINDVQASRKYFLKIFHTCVFILAEKYDVPGLLHLAGIESRAIRVSNDWELLEYWRFVYKSSGPQSALRIANTLSGLEDRMFGFDINSTRIWILKLWASEGGAKGSRNGESTLLECLRESPELARDFLIFIAGATE